MKKLIAGGWLNKRLTNKTSPVSLTRLDDIDDPNFWEDEMKRLREDIRIKELFFRLAVARFAKTKGGK